MKHLDVVIGILIFNHTILCTKRGIHTFPYLSFKYEFPGGKIETGESRPSALMRELDEELGIQISISEDDFFSTVHYTYPDFSVTLHSYLCRLTSDVFIMKEHIDFTWKAVSELKTLSWAPADIQILDDLMKRGIA